MGAGVCFLNSDSASGPATFPLLTYSIGFIDVLILQATYMDKPADFSLQTIQD